MMDTKFNVAKIDLELSEMLRGKPGPAGTVDANSVAQLADATNQVSNALVAVNNVIASTDQARKSMDDRFYPGVYANPPLFKPSGAERTTGDRAVITVNGVDQEHIFKGGAWVKVLDSGELAVDDGAALIGYDGGTAQDVLDSAKPLADYAALRAYTGRAKGVRITSGGPAGFFYQDAGDTTSADDGGTVIVDAAGRRWKRLGKDVRLSYFDSALTGNLRLGNALAAAALTGELLVDADVSVSASVNCPAWIRIRGVGGVITQTADLTPIFICSGPGSREFQRLQARGKKTDYVNSSSVWSAAGIVARDRASVEVLNCELLNFAGCGVRLLTTATRCHVRETTITGPGEAYITSTTFNYGAGIAVDNAVTHWSVSGCDISGSAQGIVTGDSQEHVRIVNNHIHDIPGQHGAYIESVSNLVFANNDISNCGLTGMKVQIGITTAPDGQRFIVGSNVVSNVGAQGILITNPVGGTPRLREFVVSGNVVSNDLPGGNAGIHLVCAVGGKVEGNIVQRTQRGVFLENCSQLDVSHNRISHTLMQGIYGTTVTDSNLSHNVIRNAAGASDSATAWGIHIIGVGSARLKFTANDVGDQGAKMRAAMYFSEGDQASCQWEGNVFVDGQQYGARLDSARSVGKWRNNIVEGLLAPVLGFPAGFTTKGGIAQRYVSASLPTSGVYQLGDEVMLPSPAASSSPGWLVTAAGGAMSGAWVNGATYIAGTWMRNAAGRVYKLVTAGAGTVSVQPTSTALGATETGADGYVWLCMHTASARFAPLPAVGAIAALP